MKQVIQFIHSNWPVYIEAHISDIHFGVIDPRIQYQILQEQFLTYLAEMRSLDIVSINGDLFDHKFMANAEAVLYASYFINDLVKICKSKRATLILIAGTASHDADQLKLFAPYLQDPDIDFRLIMNECRFEWVKGKKILCIPEIYGMPKEYYESFFNGEPYDSCYMHGTFAGSIPTKNVPCLDTGREPIFCIEDFGSCRGPIISGHVHVAQRYKGDFYYTGSPLRWCFGEEDPKGFMILLHKPETRQYLIHFEEIQSFRYDTIYLDNLFTRDPKEMIDYILSIKQKGIDYLRVKITEYDEAKILMLRNYFFNRKDIQIKTDFEQQKIQEDLRKMGNKYEKYDYLFDKNLSPESILVNYINQTEGNAYWTVDSLAKFMKDLDNLL